MSWLLKDVEPDKEKIVLSYFLSTIFQLFYKNFPHSTVTKPSSPTVTFIPVWT